MSKRLEKAKTGFGNLRDYALIETAQYIVEKMTNNINFPNPTVPLANISRAIKAFQSAYEKSRHGTREDTMEKNLKRKELINNLSSLGFYVNSVAQGNGIKLESSGFDLTKTPESVGYPPAPQYLKISEGENPGEAYVDIDPVPKAAGYVFLYAPTPAPEANEEWYMKTFSSSKNYITGLKSGVKYSFKAAACSSVADKAGMYNFTLTVEKYIN